MITISGLQLVLLLAAPSVLAGVGFLGGYMAAKPHHYWRGYDDAKQGKAFRP